MAPRRIPFDERFAKYVQLGGPDECWPWTGCCFQGKHGERTYGLVRIGGRNRHAHVLTYEMFQGPVPAGLLVRHSCDNPPCCNPAHLIAGTHGDNRHDAIERGRAAVGARHASAKFTEADVITIRRLIRQGATYRGLARHYGVTHRAIRLIAIGESWRHIKEVA